MPQREGVPPPRSVAELMHSEIVSIGPDASLAELARLMRDHGVSGLPVVDGDGLAIGTVSATDLLWLSDRIRPTARRLRESGRWEKLEGMTVREVMTPDVFGLPPHASLEELLEFFARTGLHRAFVLERGVVVGIVSLTDLLELVAE